MSSAQIPVTTFYGAVYFAAILSVGFYGVSCMQTFYYYIHYQDDQRRIKAAVAALWALDTIHESLIISGVYKYLMAGLVNPLTILSDVPELIWQTLVSTLVSVPTQGFFIYRIYIFTGKNIIVPLLWLPLGLWQLVAACIYVGKGSQTTSLATLSDAFIMNINISYSAAAVAADIAIAICLTYLLTRRQIASGLNGSARALQLLTVFAINSGIWTAIFALLYIILLRAFPTNLTSAAFDFPLCSIYCNTLLANLNARSFAKNQSSAVNVGADLINDTCVSSTRNNPSSRVQSNGMNFFLSAPHQETKNIEITTTVCTTDDTQMSKVQALAT